MLQADNSTKFFILRENKKWTKIYITYITHDLYSQIIYNLVWDTNVYINVKKTKYS